MRLSITIAYPSQVLSNTRAEDRITRLYPLLDALSVNIKDSGWRTLAEEAKAAGVPLRTHAYPGELYATSQTGRGVKAPRPELDGSSRLTADGAYRLGQRAAQAASQVGAYAHEFNGEAGIYRGTVRRRNGKGEATAWTARPDVPVLTRRWAEGFIGAGGALTEVWDLSFLVPELFYPRPVPEYDPTLTRLFTQRSVMAYSTDARQPWKRNLNYYRDRVKTSVSRQPDLPVILVPGSGRLTDTGGVVGDAIAIRKLVQERPKGLVEVSPYIPGHGGWRQLFEGNMVHESIVDLFTRIRGEARC